MKTYKVAVIGGGASGLAAAIFCGKEYGSEVVVIEKNDRVGKKLLSTGNGRGNITNLNLSSNKYHSVSGDAFAFVSFALSEFNNDQTVSFMRELGVFCTEENDKIFPMSLQASSVTDMMRFKLASLGVDIVTDFKVVEVSKDKRFIITSAEGAVINAEKIIFAFGGKCAKQFGTDGSSYSLAKKFGHTVTDLYPSLVQIKTDPSEIKGLKGIKQYSKITYKKANKSVSSCGDVLFTDYGISGNAVFYISSYLAGEKNCTLSLDLLPNVSFYELKTMLEDKLYVAPYLTSSDLLNGVINKQIGKFILKTLKLNLEEKCPKYRINDVVAMCKSFPITVKGTLGFDNAQVTRGGISLNEVNAKTMQSNLKNGLYIIGEALDIDGDCGGYNVQWAFSSAYVASKNIIKSN